VIDANIGASDAIEKQIINTNEMKLAYGFV
jgi:hypothetical protein